MDESAVARESRVISGRWMRWLGAALVLGFASSLGVLAVQWASVDEPLTAVTFRGTLEVRLTESGVLKPSQSITYRSPLGGREAEIVFLAPEGTRVQDGDLLVRLDTSELERERERAVQELRQAQVDETIAALEAEDARASVTAASDGRTALAAEEELFRLQLADKRVERLKAELDSLEPLLDRGFITKEEIDRVRFELEQSEAELGLARRKAEVYQDRTQPLEEQRAQRQLAQRQAQLENARAKLDAAKSQAAWLEQTIARCSLYSRQPGLVIHEEYLAANPRRKIRVGDRVTASQGLVTIPEVARMVVETSVREADLHRIREGQPADVRVDAFPEARLTGRVKGVGTMARDAVSGGFEEKRFDVEVEVDPADFELRPEMTARVDILVTSRPNALLAPVNAIFEREGAFVAHVVTPWAVRTRTLALGESNGVHVEILEGLDQGDRLRLVDLTSIGSARESDAPAPQAAPEGAKQFAPR